MQATKRDVRAAFERFAKAMQRIGDPRTYTLEIWSPGDGKTRYQVDCDSSHVTSYALGAGNAAQMLHAMCEVAERIELFREGSE